MMIDNTPVLGRNDTADMASQRVLQNTYRLLGLSLLPTVAGAIAGINFNFTIAAQHPIIFMLSSLVIMFGFFFGIRAHKDSSVGVVLLLAMTFFMGLLLGPILQHALHMKNGAQIIGMAAGGTGLIFLTLSSIAATTKRNFGFMGNFLAVGLLLVIIASAANMFFHIPAISLALSAVSVLLFSGFILYDVNKIVNGGETNYVIATLDIYLDIYNMFTSLLRLLMAFGSDD